MPFKWGCGGQDAPDGVPDGVGGFCRSILTTFVEGSPPRTVSKYVKTQGVLIPRLELLTLLFPAPLANQVYQVGLKSPT